MLPKNWIENQHSVAKFRQHTSGRGERREYLEMTNTNFDFPEILTVTATSSSTRMSAEYTQASSALLRAILVTKTVQVVKNLTLARGRTLHSTGSTIKKRQSCTPQTTAEKRKWIWLAFLFDSCQMDAFQTGMGNFSEVFFSTHPWGLENRSTLEIFLGRLWTYYF